jgi:hypothetical protein
MKMLKLKIMQIIIPFILDTLYACLKEMSAEEVINEIMIEAKDRFCDRI